MGYSTRNNGQIKTFWPDDTDTAMYIQTSPFGAPTLWVLLNRIQDKWPGASTENITIEPIELHTDCLGYDLYDAGDHTDFLLITKTNGA